MKLAFGSFPFFDDTFSLSLASSPNSPARASDKVKQTYGRNGMAPQGGNPQRQTAREEFGLTQDEIIRAIRAGKLQYREASMHGNPWLRLLRREVEALVSKTRGKNYLNERQVKTELAHVNRELRRLRTHITRLEKRKADLLAGEPNPPAF
jgi:hypothetical protein